MTRLAVIVVNWNGKHLLGDCLGSLIRQSLAGLEIVLVDNGSSDGSVSYVREHFPGMRVIALEKNLGFAAANNRAIEATGTEFVALLNNDALADACWAERLIGAVADERIGMAASRVALFADQKRLDSAGDGMTVVGVGYKRGHREAADDYSAPELVFGASGCAMLLRRTMLQDIGLLDEDFFFSYEDADLSFRAQLRGWKCLYVPDAIVYHKLNVSIGRVSSEYVYYGQRNVEYVFFKNMPSRLLWRYLPVHFLNGILAFGYFAARGKTVPFLRSKWAFLRDLAKVRKKRREIQRRRTASDREVDSLLEMRWLRRRLAGK